MSNHVMVTIDGRPMRLAPGTSIKIANDGCKAVIDVAVTTAANGAGCASGGVGMEQADGTILWSSDCTTGGVHPNNGPDGASPKQPHIVDYGIIQAVTYGGHRH